MSKKTAKDYQTAQRRKKALEMRLEGMTYREIAARLNMTPGGVYKAVETALEDIPKEEATTYAKMKREQLDELYSVLRRRLVEGDYSVAGAIIRTILATDRYVGYDPNKHDPQTEAVRRSLADFNDFLNRLRDDFENDAAKEKTGSTAVCSDDEEEALLDTYEDGDQLD